MKGYKATYEDGSSKHGDIILEVGETYTTDDDVWLCEGGFHASQDAYDVYTFYPKGSRIFEVEITGDVDEGVDKFCGSQMTVRRELTPDEIEGIQPPEKDENGNRGYGNRGKGNRGHGNRGQSNRGDRNRGDYNRGDGNRGDYNRGDGNRGDENRGDYNLGTGNRGSHNRGDRNRGDWNRGDYNRGDSSWGIGCTGPTMIPCFDGLLHVQSDDRLGLIRVCSLAKRPMDFSHRRGVAEHFDVDLDELNEFCDRFMEAEATK